jgi:hypothetical protein
MVLIQHHIMKTYGVVEVGLELHSFLTLTLDGGVVSFTPRPLYPERTPTPIGQQAWWAPEPVWTRRVKEEKLTT